MLLAASSLLLVPSQNATAQAKRSCSFEGTVRRGESFTHRATPQLDFMLEAIPSGWIVRMLEHGRPRTAFDYAGLATPPYQSPNPILLSTDFAFRAQDAVGWNPRHFQYFRTTGEMQTAVKAYGAYMGPAGGARDAGMADLLTATSGAAQAVLEIEDARLIGGSNNQTQSAANVASHFLSTPHTVESAAQSPLGAITELRFKVTLDGVCGR